MFIAAVTLRTCSMSLVASRVLIPGALMVNKKEPAGNSTLRQRPNPITGCPLTAALAAIGGKWKMIIIYWLAEEPSHFAALRRKMPSISQKVLTQQLRELEADAIVDRHAAERLSRPVVYS